MSCWETPWEASVNLQTGELTWWIAHNSNSDPQASNLTHTNCIQGLEMDIKQANTTESDMKPELFYSFKMGAMSDTVSQSSCPLDIKFSFVYLYLWQCNLQCMVQLTLRFIKIIICKVKFSKGFKEINFCTQCHFDSLKIRGNTSH